MRLKRLELVGFKSFANKVVLDFDEGITAIVGPNGAGKSNIYDAIRWVLGEQSIKSLRGAKLEDVIFAGSDGKKPLGMAEVQLTLDNSDGFLPVDYSEVTITRRVYRSGESDFLINRQPCRLRDIQDLFTDTGLGREGYAIIGQGQVDAILSINPLDRRFILEETAGIIKYRQRKEQAQKKIAQTEFDLVRVSDLLSELKEQLVPLETQAKKAREYQNLSAELERVVLDKIALKLGELSRKQQQHTEALHTCENDAERLTAEYQGVEQASLTDQEQLSQLEYTIELLQDELAGLNEQINQAMQAAGLIEERLAHNQLSQELRLKAKDSHIEQIRNLEVQLKELGDVLSLKHEQYHKLEESVSDAEQTLSRKREALQQQRQQLELEKSAFIEFVRELADARNYGLSYQQQMQQLKQQIQFISEEAQQLEQALEEQRRLNAELVKNQKSLRRQESESEQQLLESDREYDRIVQELEQVARQEKEHTGQFGRTVSRLQALRELEKEYEGYSTSVRRLMQAGEADFRILGTVADVICVPQGLETAIEVALGSGLQYLITPDEKDAKLAIEWLKRHQAGRCTFLPLSNIKGSQFPKDYQRFWQDEDCIGPALDLVQFDPIYTPALSALLGRIVVVKDLDAALNMQRKLKSFNRIVTLAGEVVMPSGSLTGGSISQKSSGLLARKNEIARLEQNQEELRSRIEILIEAKASLEEELSRTKDQQVQTQARLYQIRLEIKAAASELAKHQAEHQHLTQLLDARHKQVEDHLATIRELEQQAAAASDSIASMEQAEASKREQIHGLEQAIAILDQELEQESTALTNSKVALTGAAAEVKQLEAQKRAVTEQVRTDQNAIAEIDQAVAELQSQQSRLRIEAAEYQERQVKLREGKQRLMEQIAACKEARLGLQEKTKQYNQQLKSLQSRIRRIDKKIYNHRLELDRIELELRRIDEELLERQLDRSDVAAREPRSSLEELQAMEIRLKNSIRELGVVNLAALQDYEAVKERVFFLQTQYDDLIQAKETLHQTIAEIDATSAERLLETYQKLRQEFQLMFKQLFKGGKADLELTDPDSILDSGVDIIAQPPGKKPQNLLLLSGGERALTAIALLLAIRKVKPTPFVVLDEIDASLDEVNLRRFAEQMRFLAQAAQFLVITHRPGTMEVADRLYGVTMADDATSQLISVLLSEE
ncbi:MAG TPA: chromosome segregation protein SMC [Limnochordia bacterium]|nr:chromosome segregation protein SMC [Limnochordia bacterium]